MLNINPNKTICIIFATKDSERKTESVLFFKMLWRKFVISKEIIVVRKINASHNIEKESYK